MSRLFAFFDFKKFRFLDIDAGRRILKTKEPTIPRASEYPQKFCMFLATANSRRPHKLWEWERHGSVRSAHCMQAADHAKLLTGQSWPKNLTQTQQVCLTKVSRGVLRLGRFTLTKMLFPLQRILNADFIIRSP